MQFGSTGRRSGDSLAAQCGYIPAWKSDYEEISFSTFNKVSTGVFEIPIELGFSVEAQDVAYYKILVSVYPGTSYSSESGTQSSRSQSFSGDGSISTPVMYVNYDTGFTPLSTFIVQGEAQNTITYDSSESLRSGARISKSMLLSSTNTPADYLLSFCKMFGLYFRYDNASRKVTILRRNDLYQDDTIDLTRRVDLSKGISIQPFFSPLYTFLQPLAILFYIIVCTRICTSDII